MEGRVLTADFIIFSGEGVKVPNPMLTVIPSPTIQFQEDTLSFLVEYGLTV
jgi:hypothetical protein